MAAFVLLTCTAWSQPLVRHSDVWRYRKETTATPAGWKTAPDSSLNATWLTGAGGFGYADNTTETSLCGTLLNDMKGSYSTVAMRKSFDITTPVDATLHLQLTVDFDDGFIAWLDGAYLASFNSPGAPNEPAFDAVAPSNHESSRGDSTGESAKVYDLGAVGTRLATGTHVLAVIGLNSSKTTSSDFVQVVDLTIVAGPPPNCVSGSIAADTTWDATKSPVNICGELTVESGATLTIDPGVIVQIESGFSITVANGGRILAEGNETNRIHFAAANASGGWVGIIVNGGVGSPETHITFADIEGNSGTAIHSNGGSVLFDHINFLTTDHQYVSLDTSSFIVSNCHFPKATAKFEPAHGTGGIKSGGHGIFRRNYFGGTVGYSDVVDFTGGNRPQPIVHFINNVIERADDDGFDLDGTDAWVEGNILAHVHRNGDTPDSSAAISGGSNAGATSDVTIVGNLFFDCDNAITAKQGNYYALVNNTIIHTTKIGGIDGGSGALNVRDTTPSPTTFALGVYAEGNIVWDAEQLVRNYDAAQTTVTLVDNIVPTTWSGPGSANVVTDPLLQHTPSVVEATFGSWEGAQIVRKWFALKTNSPAVGTGPNGRDKGGVVSMGALIYGEPIGTTTNRDATLHVGFHRTGFAMPPTGWPTGMGYTHYKWRLDGGPWSPETPIATPIQLTNLPEGAHYVEISGKRDSGLYQDDPLFGEDAVVSRSRDWTVTSGIQSLAFQSIIRQNDQISLVFQGNNGESYTLFARDSLDANQTWTKVQNIGPQTAAGPVTITDQVNGRTSRFYFLQSPAIP